MSINIPKYKKHIRNLIMETYNTDKSTALAAMNR